MFPSNVSLCRRGSSPSKIPIKGSYIPLRTSTEDLLRDTSGVGRLVQDSEEEEELELVGGGEGMAESVLGEEFLLADTRRSPPKSRIPSLTSAPARSVSRIFLYLCLSDCLTHSLTLHTSPPPLLNFQFDSTREILTVNSARGGNIEHL